MVCLTCTYADDDDWLLLLSIGPPSSPISSTVLVSVRSGTAIPTLLLLLALIYSGSAALQEERGRTLEWQIERRKERDK